jgi:hypothetical protein
MKIALIGATAIIATAALGTPAMAQAVIYEPGYCAQFYPNANCQNEGPGNPYTGGGYWGRGWQQGYGYWGRGWQQGYASMDRHWYPLRRYYGR